MISRAGNIEGGRRHGTLGGLAGKCGGVVGGRAASSVNSRELGGVQHVLTDEAFVTMGECINVCHHASWAVDDSKVVA